MRFVVEFLMSDDYFFYFVVVCFFILTVGFIGILIFRKNVIYILLSFEILIVGVCCLFGGLSCYLDDFIFQLFSLAILGVAAAESALGLTILVLNYSIYNSVELLVFSNLKG